MKRISRIRLVSVMAILLAVLFSCQTMEPVDTFIPEITASSELPVVLSQSYYDYEVTVSADDGSAVVTYPENVVTISDAEALLRYEAGKHGEDARHIIYDVSTPGKITLSYPKGSSAEELRNIAGIFLSDIAEYVDSLFPPAEPEAIGNEVIQEPEIIEYQVLGYTAEFIVEDGKTTLTLPPVVLESDVDGFFAYEVAKYGSYVDGIYYRYTGNAVELTYPETISREDVKTNLPLMVDDIAEYAATLAAPIAEETATMGIQIAEEPVAEEPVSEPEVIEYQVLGYTAEFTVEDGKTTLALPPVVLESDVDGFFAYEVVKYGSYVDGIYYRYTGDAVELTYPETISREDVKTNLPFMVDDIAEYAATLTAPIAEESEIEVSEPAVIASAPVLEEPEIIEPLVVRYEYLGSDFIGYIYTGELQLILPEIVTDSDVEGFFASEVEKYGSMLDEVYYRFIPEGVAISYPVDIPIEEIRDVYVPLLAEDIVAYWESLNEPEASVAIPAEEPVLEIAEESAVPEPEVIAYQVLGYTAEFTVEDGKTTLALPPVVLESDVDGFFAYEMAKYGSYVDGIYYRYTGDAVELTYPETITREDVKSNLPYMVADIEEYASKLTASAVDENVVSVEEISVPEETVVVETAPEEPEVITYPVLGYTAEFTVEDGKTTLALPPVVLESDVDGFFAYEVAKYGSYVDGIYYRYTGDAVELTYPETITREDVKLNLPYMVEDIEEYAAMLVVAVEETTPEEPVEVVEEAATKPEVITYQVLGYTAEFTVEDGKTTLALPPVVLESDVDGFFAYEVAKYGSYVDGIYYRYTGDAVELTYPETITREDVKLNLPYMVVDIAEYAATLTAPTAEESEIEVSEPAVIASAPVIEEPEIIEPLVVRYEYLGSEFIGYIYTGELQLILPEIVTDSDVEGFFASEVEKYGSMLDGVYYRFIPEGVAISYPVDIPIEEIRDVYVPLLAEDIVAYWESLNEPEPVIAEESVEEPDAGPAVEVIAEPEVITYQVLGYTAEFTVEDGKTTLALPPVVLKSDVDGFFAYEVAKYGSYVDGIYYRYTGNAVELTYPETISREDVKLNLPYMVADIEEYAATLAAEEPAQEEVSEETAVAEEPAPVIIASAPVLEEPEIIEPLVVRYEYLGSDFIGYIYTGELQLILPEIVTDSDVEGFFASEVEKYGSMLDGVYYRFIPEGVAISYPEDIPIEEIRDVYVPLLAEDIVAYWESLNEPEPVIAEESVEEPDASPAVEVIAEPDVITYQVLGYTAEFTVEDGKTTLALPPVVLESDVDGFFAYEVAKYGSYVDGIYYRYTGNAVELTYPETITREDVKLNLPYMVADIEEYAATLMIPATEEIPVMEESVPVEEVAVPEEPAAEEESVEYPFGIQPIVKNDQGSDEFNLIVVHTNDVHGRIEEGDGLIGYSRLSTLLNMARAMTDNVLVLDAGDTFHGTVLANYTEGQTVAEIMDMLGYDAMVPGNHDFNYGFQRLLGIDAWTDDNDSFKVLSANISDESGMLYFQPYQIYSFNGFDVCVIGLTTPDTKLMSHPANTEGVEFISQDIIDNAQRAIDVAHEIADYVIVLGHMGFGPALPESITSADIASAVDGIDLFIDGHSHTAMDGGERVNGTLIVSAGEYLENIGVVDIHVKDGEAVSEDAFLITADDVETPAESSFFASMGIKSVLSDPEVDEYISGKQAELDSVLGRSIGYLPMNLNGEREDVRTRKTNLSKMICDAMTQESGADFSIINGGSIRASLEAGPITAGDILEVLPFENIIVTCEVTPADIYKILELGYSNLPESAGAFTQTDLKIVYSPSASQGERIRRVYLDDILLDRSDDETVYVVATNDFLAAGGDDFEFGQKLSEGRLISEVFQEYLEKLY